MMAMISSESRSSQFTIGLIRLRASSPNNCLTGLDQLGQGLNKSAHQHMLVRIPEAFNDFVGNIID